MRIDYVRVFFQFAEHPIEIIIVILNAPLIFFFFLGNKKPDG